MNLQALVVINSNSKNYEDFKLYIRPYFEVFGLPYVLWDRAKFSLNDHCLNHNLIILGHYDIGARGKGEWTEEERCLLFKALSIGIGVVSFDENAICTLKIGSIQRENRKKKMLQISNVHNYIIELHTPGEEIELINPINVPKIELFEGAEAIVYAEDCPYLIYKPLYKGVIIAWLGYEWIAPSIKGPVNGLDDLIWRSLVFAAKKPFVLRELPPFATLRIDDCVGDHGYYKDRPFEWVDIANEFGFIPWLGFFHETISEPAVEKMKELVRQKKATAQFHGIYLFGSVYKNKDATMSGIRSTIQNWIHQNDWNAPLSSYFIPHNYDLSKEALAVLGEIGIEYIGLPYPLDCGGGSNSHSNPWINSGPYREFWNGSDGIPWSGEKKNSSFYYADWFTDEKSSWQFFNVLTEIRDINGYEWFNYAENACQYEDISEAVKKGTLILKRCFDSKVFGNLFTHEDSWRGKFIANIKPENWRKMLEGIVSSLSDYNPRFVSMDEGLQYVKSLKTSSLKSVMWNEHEFELKLQFEGDSYCTTDITVYWEQGGYINKQCYPITDFTKRLECKIRLDYLAE